MTQFRSYQKLCTEFYDLSKPEASPDEVSFYLRRLQASQGPILEAMCGSGRVMLPLLRAGIEVDGVDFSEDMLSSCRRRAEKEGFRPTLFHQSLEVLDLKRTYSVIFVALGSFQLFTDRNVAESVLKKLATHLNTGGKLILDTLIPWADCTSTIPTRSNLDLWK